jgi:hypothetical protein
MARALVVHASLMLIYYIMKSKVINLSLLVLLGVGIVSCSDDDNDVSGPKNATLVLKSSATTLKTSESISFTEATIKVEEVEFESLEINDDDFEVDFEGPFAIDLLTGKSQPTIPSSFLLPGKYEEVELELDDDISPNIMIAGAVAVDAETAINFVFSSSEDIEFEAEAEEAGQAYLFEVLEGEDINIVMEFQLNEWFNGVDLASGTVGDDNILTISKQENVTLYNQIINNIKQSKLVVSTN